jgi:hypothetical protein
MADVEDVQVQPASESSSDSSSDSNRKPSKPLVFIRLYLGGRYVWLMSALFVLTIGGPLFGSFGIINDFYVGDILVVAVLGTAAITFFSSRIHTAVIVFLALGGAIFGIVARVPIEASANLEIAGLVFETVLLFYMILLIGGDVFTTTRVDADTICGSVSVYLLLGGVFGTFYSIVHLLDPASFSGITTAFAADPSLGPNRALMYYSFVTLTTLGYGDITPVNMFARSAANLEAISGQLYLTVLVARLVGQHLATIRTSTT